MEKIGLFAVRLSRIFAYIGALTVVAMMLLICLDVVTRNLFRISYNTTPEVVARYFMVGIAFLPISWLELRRQMISVELIEFALTPALRRLSDLLVMLVATVIYGLLAWTSWEKALKEFKSGTLVEIATWKMPVWHSYFIPPIGFTLGVVACLIVLVAILSPAWNSKLEFTTNER